MARRPRSPAQIAASRANGRRSQGPRSADGKARSRRNALKHGLRAATLELLAPGLAEPALTFAAEIEAQILPQDVIEKELSQGIAVALWRLRRARELEDALTSGRTATIDQDGLANTFLRRGRGAGAMALLLRYRNQALGELSRLLRLLKIHRGEPAGSLAPLRIDRETIEAGLRKGGQRAGPAAADDNDNEPGTGTTTPD